ncbi:Hypothetical predicted protein, partial [Scomber scombrus]
HVMPKYQGHPHMSTHPISPFGLRRLSENHNRPLIDYTSYKICGVTRRGRSKTSCSSCRTLRASRHTNRNLTLTNLLWKAARHCLSPGCLFKQLSVSPLLCGY